MNENFLKNLKQALTETAEVVSKKTEGVMGVVTKKTEDVVEIQKLRSKIYNAKKNVEVDYKKLGTIIYQRYLSGEAMDEELADLCEAIHDLLEEADKYQDELAEKKGLNICESCDTSNPKEAVFCMKCGSKLPVKEAEPCAEGCPEECFVDEEEDIKDGIIDDIVNDIKEDIEDSVKSDIIDDIVNDIKGDIEE